MNHLGDTVSIWNGNNWVESILPSIEIKQLTSQDRVAKIKTFLYTNAVIRNDVCIGWILVK